MTTVSRVVNNSPLVSAEQQQQIKAILDEMGYQSAPIEKRKGVRKEPKPWINHKILKIVLFGPHDLFWITNYAPIYSYVLHGIDQYLNSIHLQRSIERVETEAQLLQLLKKSGTDGFLILSTTNDPLPRSIEKYPVVVFMGMHDHGLFDRVTPDPASAGVLAAEYLHSKDCSFGVALGGAGAIYHKRSESFSRTLGNWEIKAAEILDDRIVRGKSGMHQANRDVILEQLLPIFSQQKKPVGIFSMADIVTPVLYSTLNEAGIKIGQDVFIVTCNNERPFLDALHPMPAVIDIKAEFIGRRAVEQILRRLQNTREPNENIRILPELILPDRENQED